MELSRRGFLAGTGAVAVARDCACGGKAAGSAHSDACL